MTKNNIPNENGEKIEKIENHSENTNNFGEKITELLLQTNIRTSEEILQTFFQNSEIPTENKKDMLLQAFEKKPQLVIKLRSNLKVFQCFFESDLSNDDKLEIISRSIKIYESVVDDEERLTAEEAHLEEIRSESRKILESIVDDKERMTVEKIHQDIIEKMSIEKLGLDQERNWDTYFENDDFVHYLITNNINQELSFKILLKLAKDCEELSCVYTNPHAIFMEDRLLSVFIESNFSPDQKGEIFYASIENDYLDNYSSRSEDLILNSNISSEWKDKIIEIHR